MAITRRTFIKTVLGGASFATSSGIFFPKPANSYSMNYLLSQDGKVDPIFKNFLLAQIARNPSTKLPTDTAPAVISIVKSVQNEFTQRDFTQNQTPFAQRLGNLNNPLWGRQRQENVGPNPGFGTVQIDGNAVSSITFTGSTTVGINGAIQALGKDEHRSPSELDDALIPVRQQFEDWGTWSGDVNPNTKQGSGTSITTYETRSGEVSRFYEVKEPGPGGFGVIKFIIDAGPQFKSSFVITVNFK